MPPSPVSSVDLLHKLASALVSLSNLPKSPTQYSSPYSGNRISTPNLSANVRAAHLLYSCPFPGGSYCLPSLLPTCHINTCPSYAWTPHSWTSTGISGWFPVSNHPIAYPSTDSFMDTVTKAICLSSPETASVARTNITTFPWKTILYATQRVNCVWLSFCIKVNGNQIWHGPCLMSWQMAKHILNQTCFLYVNTTFPVVQLSHAWGWSLKTKYTSLP